MTTGQAGTGGRCPICGEGRAGHLEATCLGYQAKRRRDERLVQTAASGAARRTVLMLVGLAVLVIGGGVVLLLALSSKAETPPAPQRVQIRIAPRTSAK